MKRLPYILLTLALVSCGTRRGFFRIEGHFLHLNQGEFYVYSTDGLVNGIDTIPINGGRFTYEKPCQRPGTLMLVFPNFSEQPVFAESGKSVDIKADAQNLKEMTMKGTEDNDLMTQFRLMIAKDSPDEAIKHAEMFIKDHPQSPVSAYLLRRYFMQGRKPDYKKASSLADLLIKAQPKNGSLVILKRNAEVMRKSAVNTKLPSFSAYDINGKVVSNADLQGKVAVINVWTSWNYDSKDVQNRLKRIKKESGSKLAVLGINLDASKRECRNTIKYDSLQWSTVCDEMMFESPLLDKLGLYTVPDNLVMDTDGKIVARGLGAKEMEEQLNKLLKKNK